MEQGSQIIHELTGTWPVYPGHPLVLATAIMRVFPSYAAAAAPSDHGWCEALADSRITGAGDHVSAAMGVLQLGASGAHADAMVERARDYWDRGNAGGHTKNVAPGQAQAMSVEPHFRELAKRWFAN